MAEPATVKRFYRVVEVAQAGDGWQVTLDGRAIRTQGGKAQVLSSRPMAEALAGEWAAQGDEIVPSTFPLRDLADYAIDVVSADRQAAVARLLRFAETDTLCYRADPDEALFARQEVMWEPVLCSAEARHGVRFQRISGIIHRPQPSATLAALGAHLAGQNDFTLAALNTLASLAASLTVALAALEDGADAAALWGIANLEEDWQAELWGADALAMEQRERRLATFASALGFAALSRTV